jgi:hypothetical protein
MTIPGTPRFPGETQNNLHGIYDCGSFRFNEMVNKSKDKRWFCIGILG